MSERLILTNQDLIESLKNSSRMFDKNYLIIDKRVKKPKKRTSKILKNRIEFLEIDDTQNDLKLRKVKKVMHLIRWETDLNNLKSMRRPSPKQQHCITL